MGTPTVSQAKAWTPAGMHAQAEQSEEHGQAAVAHAKQMERAADSTADHLQGDAGKAARAHAAQIYQQGMQTAKGLFAAGDAQNAGAAAIEGEQQAAVSAISGAEAEQFDVAEDGTASVRPALIALVAAVRGRYAIVAVTALEAKAHEYTEAIKGHLAGMGRAADDASRAIDAAYKQLPKGMAPPHVDSRGDSKEVPPAETKKWWDSLNPEQQQAEIDHHPDDIRNRDGIPDNIRHEANVKAMPIERKRLEDQLKWYKDNPIESHLGAFASGRPLRSQADIENRLKDIDAVEAALKKSPDRKLLLFDMESGKQGRAAIAVGDPDRANHVSVTTPGMNSSVHESLGTMTDQAADLKRESERQLSNVPGREKETVSTIAWMGYDPPQFPIPTSPQGAGHLMNAINQHPTDTATGLWDFTHDDVAKSGAHDLARFYDGLGATNSHPDPHITAIGHSYGSLTTGLALQQPGHHPVSDMAVYGSPGVEAATPQHLGLQPGHAYAMRTPDDPINHAYIPQGIEHDYPALRGLMRDTNSEGFGPDPATNPNFVHMQTQAATAPDGTPLAADGTSQHGDYPTRDGTKLRTSESNLAAIIAGLPGNVIRTK